MDKIAICVGRAFNKRLGTVHFLLSAGSRGPSLWQDGLKSPIARSEELAGGSCRRGPLSRQDSSMQCRTILADASKVLKDGGALRCNAMRCDACQVGLRGRGGVNNTPGSNSSRG